MPFVSHGYRCFVSAGIIVVLRWFLLDDTVNDIKNKGDKIIVYWIVLKSQSYLS